MPSPTQRSLALLKARGYTVAIVEHWNPFAHIRQDLFGFGDLLAIRKGEVLLVQVTTGGNVSKRVDKITAHDNYPRVVESGIAVSVHGWRKLKAGWLCREVEL